MPSKIRIAVVDDHPLFREGVVHTLSAQEDMVIVGEGSTADDAIRLAGSNLPAVMLLDFNLDGDAMKALETITAEYPSVGVLMLTVVSDEECVSTAMKLGARGYILKGVSGPELTGGVRRVSQKELYVSPSLAAHLLQRMYNGTPDSKIETNRFADLTEREQQILTLVSQALSNKEIALRTSLTEKTVKHHLTSILRKLPARNRVEAALLAAHRALPATRPWTDDGQLLQDYSQG